MNYTNVKRVCDDDSTSCSVCPWIGSGGPVLCRFVILFFRYGIDLGLVEWKLRPLEAATPFAWAIGRTDVSHNSTGATIRHPGRGARRVIVSGLKPNAEFVAGAGPGCGVAASTQGRTDPQGVASWSAADVRCGVWLELR